MRVPLHQLAQSGATDQQVPGWDNVNGLWVPGDVVRTITSSDGSVTVDDTDPQNVDLTVVGGGGGSLTVQDENGAVATGVTQIDFQGAGVTASAGTGEVVVTIPGGSSGGSSFRGCFLRKAASQALAANTDTAMVFDTEDLDTDGFHDNVTNNTRFTVPAGLGGKYMVSVGARVLALANGKALSGYLKRNGTTYEVGRFFAVSLGGSAADVAGSFGRVFNLAAGDYLELFANQNDTVSRNTEAAGTYLSAHYLGT